ncbi:MAG: hypothetical protein OXC30_02690 [Alphaproteobacteria bacterium]|nr:hypothetical protein [Alphaproteobacteria bacterium]
MIETMRAHDRSRQKDDWKKVSASLMQFLQNTRDRTQEGRQCFKKGRIYLWCAKGSVLSTDKPIDY